MKRLAIAIFCLVLLGCGKNNTTEPQPVYTAVDGVWTYTTADKAISVDFELKTSGTTIGIINTTINVSGTAGQAAGQIAGVNIPAIDEIRINANDAALVQPYMISFVNCTVNETFNTITVAGGEYTYPWGSTKTFQSAIILRK